MDLTYNIIINIYSIALLIIICHNSLKHDEKESLQHKLYMMVLKNTILMLVLAVFFLTNPMAYTFGRFLPEKYKPAFYDAAVSFVHPIVGLFPHANPAELFVYMGIAQGIEQLGFPLGQLAIRYFIVGVIVIFIRGIVTEMLTLRMMRQRDLI
jgi:PTS system glucitol/sorbitol-specific IIC component